MNTSILKTVGNTPLIKIEGISFKLETTNPTGSIKDRMTSFLIQKAEEKGLLKPGQKIIEVTSGNTGISFAWISAIKGYRFQAIMPKSMSIERRRMIEVFGGELILTPKEKDMQGAVEKFQKIKKLKTEAWFPEQFENPNNLKAYQIGFAKEIIHQTQGKIDAFVATVGSGGSLLGTAFALKKFNPAIKIIAVEPRESAVLSGGKPGLHKIQGIGEGFIPKIIKDNLDLIDEIITIDSNKAIAAQEYLTKKHGLLVGISSGANFLAAKKISDYYKNIVSIFPDRGERYLN